MGQARRIHGGFAPDSLGGMRGDNRIGEFGDDALDSAVRKSSSRPVDIIGALGGDKRVKRELENG